MPAQLLLQVPKTAWPDIEVLLALPLETVRGLSRYLATAAPVPDIEDLAERCADLLPIGVPQAVSILKLLINLKRLHRGWTDSSESVFDAFEQAVERAGFPEWNAGKGEAWKERKPLIVPLLSAENAISIMSKVRMLLFESQCVLQQSLVLTDVRPIYDEAGTEIKGGMVLHTLCLEFSEGNDSRQIHLTLTADDVSKLIAQLKRDQRKALAATALLAKNELPELTPKRNIQV